MSAKCVACLAVVVVVVAVSMFAASFAVVTPLRAGLRRNAVTGKVSNNKVYTAGRYFLGLGQEFLYFPTTLNVIEFSRTGDAGPIQSQTGDGQLVTLDYSFLYRLDVNSITQLFAKYALNYRANYIAIAESELKIALGNFVATDFFENRTDIGEAIQVALNARLRDEFAVVEFGQLRAVRINGLEESVIDKLVEAQNAERANALKDGAQVRARTRVIDNQAQQEVRVIAAEADSTADVIVSRASAQAIEIRAEAAAQAYRRLMDGLGYTPRELLRHLWYDTLRQQAGANTSLVTGTDASALLTL